MWSNTSYAFLIVDGQHRDRFEWRETSLRIEEHTVVHRRTFFIERKLRFKMF